MDSGSLKRSCARALTIAWLHIIRPTVMFDGDSVAISFDFQTTRQRVYEFMEKVPEGSIVVIESSTTGKVLSRMLSGKY
jgi:hypothetical protein